MKECEYFDLWLSCLGVYLTIELWLVRESLVSIECYWIWLDLKVWVDLTFGLISWSFRYWLLESQSCWPLTLRWWIECLYSLCWTFYENLIRRRIWKSFPLVFDQFFCLSSFRLIVFYCTLHLLLYLQLLFVTRILIWLLIEFKNWAKVIVKT